MLGASCHCSLVQALEVVLEPRQSSKSKRATLSANAEPQVQPDPGIVKPVMPSKSVAEIAGVPRPATENTASCPGPPVVPRTGPKDRACLGNVTASNARAGLETCVSCPSSVMRHFAQSSTWK